VGPMTKGNLSNTIVTVCNGKSEMLLQWKLENSNSNTTFKMKTVVNKDILL